MRKLKETIQKVFETFGYTLDPHGAVAYAALQQYLAQQKAPKDTLLKRLTQLNLKTL